MAKQNTFSVFTQVLNKQLLSPYPILRYIACWHSNILNAQILKTEGMKWWMSQEKNEQNCTGLYQSSFSTIFNLTIRHPETQNFRQPAKGLKLHSWKSLGYPASKTFTLRVRISNVSSPFQHTTCISKPFSFYKSLNLHVYWVLLCKMVWGVFYFFGRTDQCVPSGKWS